MNYTTHYRLQKDLTVEKYDVNVVNMNSDIIDSALHRLDLKNQNQDELLATKESLNSEITRATSKENDIIEDLTSEISRAKSVENVVSNNLLEENTRALLAEETISTSLQEHISDESNPHNVTKTQVGLGNADNTSDIDKPVSTAQQNALNTALSTHNTSESSHSDIRLLISGLTTRLNAIADSDDTTLDQLSEIVAYIKNNKSLIDGITTSKVNVSDIIDDLTTNSGDKVLSAKQGTILKGLITDLTEIVGTKVDKVSGKVLSTNDYTTEEKNKLNGIATGAEVNVQADWNVTDANSGAFIKNKPNIPTVPTSLPANGGNSDTSTKWATARNIDGMSVQGDANRTTYGTCSTAAATTAKVVACTGFTLVTGAKIDVKFTVTNTSANPTLNVNNTGAKPIYYRGSAISVGYLAANRTYSFRYNGIQWDLVGDLDTNTTYGVVSTSANGLCPKRTGTTTKFLRDDGTWAVPTSGSITYSDSQPTTLSAGMTWIGN